STRRSNSRLPRVPTPARRVAQGLAGLVVAWLVLAWLGLAWLGLAWLGLAWQHFKILGLNLSISTVCFKIFF
ncbi:hypothetical protein M5091_00705, partial [Neisseria meningitidis]|nr:hypothetical protein [Neisseria meningitidis]